MYPGRVQLGGIELPAVVDQYRRRPSDEGRVPSEQLVVGPRRSVQHQMEVPVSQIPVGEVERPERHPLAIRQTSTWESRSDFERYWFSEEIEQARAAVIDLYDIPLLPAWHTLLAAE